MKCPYCGAEDARVVDSRQADEGNAIRRRRECAACLKRFNTFETIETVPLMVIKRDGTRQPFDRSKIINGLVRACEKRQVSLEAMERIADDVEQHILNELLREVRTETIGELVMNALRPMDQVAYVRFASVYRQFKDINSFMEELSRLLKDNIP